MKKISFLLTAILLINISFVALAQDNTPYNNQDIHILKSIYQETQNNIDILDWNIAEPSTINEAEWKRINDEYHLASLDLSNISVNGDINLTDCQFLEECHFANTDINSIHLPSSLKTISNKSFENCSKLQVITITADETVIGSNAFSGCISLKSIVNAEKIISIGRNTFNNCENLNFYFSENKANLYIENYARQYDFNIINSINSDIYGYVGIMYNRNYTKFDLTKMPLVYSSGTVSLYTSDKQLIETVNIDENGKFSLDNLTIGKKYRIVIDGKSAIPREEYFIPVTQDYCIAPDTECFGVIVCDYNRDGIVNSSDAQDFSTGLQHNKNDSNFDISIYDFNCDGYCNAIDTSCFITFLSIDYHNFNYNSKENK